MSKRLSLQYYYNNDGSLDTFTRLLTCFDAPLYFILKNKVANIDTPCEAFLRDITFYLSQNSDGSIYDIGFLDNSINSDLFKLKWYGGKGTEALNQVESLLDAGELVMIQTDTRRVPFLRNYQGASSIDDGVAVPGHVFLAVYQDKAHLYYAEAPWNINTDNFQVYEGNESIGVIRKDDLRSAFDSFLNCITITLNEDGLFKYDRMKGVLEKSAKNFDKKTLNSDGFIFSYGKEAIERLVDVCRREFLYLNQDVSSYSLDLFGLLNWKLWDIVKRRQLLYQYFIKHSKQYNSLDVESVTAAIQSDVAAWMAAIETILKRNVEKKYLLDSQVQKYFMEVAIAEEKVNTSLKKIFT